MPIGSRVLTVQSQNGQPAIWVLVDPKHPEEERSFRMCGTGHRISEDETTNYIGTFQMDNGSLVLHLFELDQKLR
jgi:hypothetical protein